MGTVIASRPSVKRSLSPNSAVGSKVSGFDVIAAPRTSSVLVGSSSMTVLSFAGRNLRGLIAASSKVSSSRPVDSSWVVQGEIPAGWMWISRPPAVIGVTRPESNATTQTGFSLESPQPNLCRLGLGMDEKSASAPCCLESQAGILREDRCTPRGDLGTER